MALVFRDGKYYEDGKEIGVNPGSGINPGTGQPYSQTGMTGADYSTPPFTVPSASQPGAVGTGMPSFLASEPGAVGEGVPSFMVPENTSAIPAPILGALNPGQQAASSVPSVPGLSPWTSQQIDIANYGTFNPDPDAYKSWNHGEIRTNPGTGMQEIYEGGNTMIGTAGYWKPYTAPVSGFTGADYTTPPFMVPGSGGGTPADLANILNPGGSAGIAKPAATLPTAGVVGTGTPPFMVPENTSTTPGAVGTPADLAGILNQGAGGTPADLAGILGGGAGTAGAVGEGIPPFMVGEQGAVGSGVPGFLVGEQGVSNQGAVGSGIPPFLVNNGETPGTPGTQAQTPEQLAAADTSAKIAAAAANGYGYTPAEEADIYNRAYARFNEQTRQDLGNMQNMYEQYGWRTGAPEIGGQAINALNQYMGRRNMAESDLTSQLAEQIASRRGSNETTAVNNMLNTLRYMSEEEQRNFLNQQGISDRATQDYWMGVTTNWGQQMDAANVSDRNLNTWLDYVKGYDVTPKDYLAGQYGADSSLYDTTNTALRGYYGEGNMMSIPILKLMSDLAGGGNGGTTVNVGTGAGVGGSGAAGTAAGVADVIGDGGKWVWDTAKKAWNWVKNAGTDKTTETPGGTPGTSGTQVDLDRILGGAAGTTAGITGGYSPAGTAVAGTVGALAGAAGGGIMLAGQLLTNYIDNTVGAKAVKEQQRYFIDEIGKYESTAPLVKDLTPQELYNVSVDLMKVWTAKSGTMTKEQIWNTYGKSYLYDVNMAKQGWVKGRDY